MSEPRTRKDGELRIYRDRVMREHCGDPWSEREEDAMRGTLPYQIAELEDRFLAAWLPTINASLRGINWVIDRLVRR